ncbi:uncharacterized protein Tco025E_05498 [Trypanosoma conorhini]|uniref:Uncharacterized protein n=1 Tax=Trypanosoma conorhini TaxID=83891 RepID=A0A3R7P198_9TRYP|nr:uncharacterized protein Tco025E_05498 [Trypanosoma conorhini]RNF15527.1 hypothetical protein Tco025E_05498 [Trypanosoma conorhini]
MSTTRPCNCEFILPSRFAAARPPTWRLVMDDAGAALAARYSGEVAPQRLPDEAALRSRDQRIRAAASRRRTAVAAGPGNGATRDTRNGARAEEGSRTAAAAFLTERVAAVSGSASSRPQRTPPRECFPREVPVSLFH